MVLLKYVFYMIGFDLSSLEMCFITFFFFFIFLGSTTSSSTIHNEAELGDDDVFTVSSLCPLLSRLVGD